MLSEKNECFFITGYWDIYSLLCMFYSETELYGVPMNPIVPVAPRINVPNLIKQSSIESGWDRSISGGGVLNSTQASQALCGLSQEVDR